MTEAVFKDARRGRTLKAHIWYPCDHGQAERVAEKRCLRGDRCCQGRSRPSRDVPLVHPAPRNHGQLAEPLLVGGPAGGQRGCDLRGEPSGIHLGRCHPGLDRPCLGPAPGRGSPGGWNAQFTVQGQYRPKQAVRGGLLPGRIQHPGPGRGPARPTPLDRFLRREPGTVHAAISARLCPASLRRTLSRLRRI